MMDLCARLKEEISGTNIEEFNELEQIDSIEDYLESWTHLKG